MVGRRPGKTRPRAGRSGGVPKVASFAWTDVPQPNGPGLPPDAPTTLAPGLPPLPHTAAKTSRDTRGKATSWCTAEVPLQLVAPSWVSLFQRFCDACKDPFRYSSISFTYCRIFTFFLPGARMEAWWEKAENGMNHTVKIGSLRMSILVVDCGSGRFCSTCSAERNGRFLRRSNW